MVGLFEAWGIEQAASGLWLRSACEMWTALCEPSSTDQERVSLFQIPTYGKLGRASILALFILDVGDMKQVRV
jgi:hypothetical protein